LMFSATWMRGCQESFTLLLQSQADFPIGVALDD
jgi:hypothetical protein